MLQHACADAGIPAVSLWAAVPHYVAQPPSPKATLALLRGVEDVLDLSLPLADLAEEARAWERGVDELAEQDTEVADYVRTLEEAKDATDLPEASGDAIAREFERYLRRRGDPGDRRARAPAALTPGLAGRYRRAARGRRASPPAGTGAPGARAAARPGAGGVDLLPGQQLAPARRRARRRPAAVSSRRSACTRPAGQRLAAPLPQHGAQLVLLGEADAVVAAVQVAVGDRAAGDRSCGRRC